jgi:hypothetical protein
MTMQQSAEEGKKEKNYNLIFSEGRKLAKETDLIILQKKDICKKL